MSFQQIGWASEHLSTPYTAHSAATLLATSILIKTGESGAGALIRPYNFLSPANEDILERVTVLSGLNSASSGPQTTAGRQTFGYLAEWLRVFIESQKNVSLVEESIIGGRLGVECFSSARLSAHSPTGELCLTRRIKEIIESASQGCLSACCADLMQHVSVWHVATQK